MYGTLVIKERPHDEPGTPATITLNAGATLRFMEGSHVMNKTSKDGTMQLHIHMKGGKLDLSGLPPEDRSLIKVIYDQSISGESEYALKVSSLSAERMQVFFELEEDSEVMLQITALNGQRMLERTYEGVKGSNTWEINTSGLSGGLYLISFSDQNNTESLKVMLR